MVISWLPTVPSYNLSLDLHVDFNETSMPTNLYTIPGQGSRLASQLSLKGHFHYGLVVDGGRVDINKTLSGLGVLGLIFWKNIMGSQVSNFPTKND